MTKPYLIYFWLINIFSSEFIWDISNFHLFLRQSVYNIKSKFILTFKTPIIMKKSLTLAVLCIMTVLSLSAQDYYYYAIGQKFPLQLDNTRVSIYCSDQSKAAVVEQLNTIGTDLDDCSHGDYAIITETLKEGLPENAIETLSLPADAMQIECFKGDANVDLTQTGAIYIRLKDEKDAAILDEFANQYSLGFGTPDPFMPLWYTYYITAESKMSPLNIANAIYETGRVAASEAELGGFSFLASIKAMEIDNGTGDENHYDISGRLVSPTTKGIHIVKKDNGTTEKVLIK